MKLTATKSFKYLFRFLNSVLTKLEKKENTATVVALKYLKHDLVDGSSGNFLNKGQTRCICVELTSKDNAIASMCRVIEDTQHLL